MSEKDKEDQLKPRGYQKEPSPIDGKSHSYCCVIVVFDKSIKDPDVKDKAIYTFDYMDTDENSQGYFWDTTILELEKKAFNKGTRTNMKKKMHQYVNDIREKLKKVC